MQNIIKYIYLKNNLFSNDSQFVKIINFKWLLLLFGLNYINNKVRMHLIMTILRYCNTKQKIASIPSLRQFVKSSQSKKAPLIIQQGKPTYHIQTYGCQMNLNDTDIVRSVLSENYLQVDDPAQANVLLLNTCSIREKAEQKIFQRIRQASENSVVGILGCMAERLKQKLFQSGVQVVCGPDSYRDLPRLLSESFSSSSHQMNVMLSAQETYADVSPVRKNPGSVSAYISIMRGCNNMCSFCIVPFVRGRERSRNLDTVISEIASLQKQGVKEITFLGQNVNSYHDLSTTIDSPHSNTEGFKEMYKLRDSPGARFADLLQKAAQSFPNIRFRFTSPHPKDFPDEVLDAIGKHHNLCKYIHLPAQSGSSEVLSRMRRNHTAEAYLQLVDRIKDKLPGISLSTDLICGFCGQTEEQFQDTIKLLKQVKFEMAFLFAYSMREKTHAHRQFQDDVPEEVKQRRLKEMIDTFVEMQASLNEKQVGKVHVLLLEGKAKREAETLMGKTDNFKNGYVKIQKVPVYRNGVIVDQRNFKIGDYLVVRVKSCGPRALYCQPIGIADTLLDFHNYQSVFSEAGQQIKANAHSQPKEFVSNVPIQ